MFGKDKRKQDFFESLCEDYYAKVLQYLFSVLGDEATARDCTQEVFLVALQKSPILREHPNPGGFIFLTAKNIAKRNRRETFKLLLSDISLDEAGNDPSDPSSDLERMLDSEIDAAEYIELVLSRLSEEKRRLYMLYYSERLSMAEIARRYNAQEPAVRMRYVRLRKEIKAIVSEIAEKHFAV